MESIAGSPTKPAFPSDDRLAARQPPATPSKLKRLSLVCDGRGTSATPRPRDADENSVFGVPARDERKASKHVLQSPAEIGPRASSPPAAVFAHTRDRQRRTPRPLSLVPSSTCNTGAALVVGASSAGGLPPTSHRADTPSRHRLAHAPLTAPPRGARPLSLRTSSELHGLSASRSIAGGVSDGAPAARRDIAPPRSVPATVMRARAGSEQHDEGTTLMERYAELLRAIAQKEARVDETRQELRRQEAELSDLKSEWQSIASQQAGPSPLAPGSTPDSASHRRGPPKPVCRAPTGSTGASRQPITASSSGSMTSPLPSGLGAGALGGLGNLGETADQGKRIIGQLFDSIAGIQASAGSAQSQAGTSEPPMRRSDDSARTASGSSEGGSRLAAGGIGELFSGLGGGESGAWAGWDSVVAFGSPSIQEVPKRASAFLSANLTDTLNALAHILPTPNLASLPETPAGEPSMRQHQLTRPGPHEAAGRPRYQKDSEPKRERTMKETEGVSTKPPPPQRQRSFLDDDLDEVMPGPTSSKTSPSIPGGPLKALSLAGLQKPLTPVKRSISPVSSSASSSAKNDGWDW